MQRVNLRDVDIAAFRDAIGADRYAEGTAAVRQRAVIQVHWNPSEQALTGTVRDGGAESRGAGGKGGEGTGDLRSVMAEFRASAGFPLRFRVGYCSCADGVNCRHVAALVIAATDESAAPAPAPERQRRTSKLPWEQSLDSLLAETRPPAPPDPESSAETRLAIELSLVRPAAHNSRYA